MVPSATTTRMTPEEVVIAAGLWPYPWPAKNASALWLQKVHGEKMGDKSLALELEARTASFQLQVLMQKYGMMGTNGSGITFARRELSLRRLPLYGEAQLVLRNKKPEAVLLTKLALTRDIADLWGEDAVAPYAALEAEALMMLAGVSFAYVHAVVLGQSRDWLLEHDEEVARVVEGTIDEFTTRVKNREAPPPDGSPAAEKVLRARFPAYTQDFLPATPESQALVREWQSHAAAETSAKKRKKLVEQKLKAIVGSHVGILSSEPRQKVTWKANGEGNPKWKEIALAIAQGAGTIDDLMAKYRTSPERKFRVSTGDDDGVADELGEE